MNLQQTFPTLLSVILD